MGKVEKNIGFKLGNGERMELEGWCVSISVSFEHFDHDHVYVKKFLLRGNSHNIKFIIFLLK